MLPFFAPHMGTPLKVMTYNIRKGKGDHLSRRGMDALEAAMAQEAPDVILLQEAFFPHHPTHDYRSQAEHLAHHLGYHLAYTPNNAHKKGHYGNATLSRYPITVFTNYNISTNAIERRGALYARLEVNGEPLHVINTHLGLNKPQRNVQVGLLREVIEAHVPHGQPIIVAGDFNDWSDRMRVGISHRLALQDALGHLPKKDRLTWHTRWPIFSLDRIYYAGLGPMEVRVGQMDVWQGLSDHFPVVAQFAALAQENAG